VVIAARPGSSPWRIKDMLGQIAIHTVSLHDQPALRRMFDVVQPERVFYLAAQTKRPFEFDFSDATSSVSDDLTGLLNVLSAAAAAAVAPKSFVRAGSLAEYGNGSAPYLESQREKPLNAYAASLAAGTHYAQMMQPRLPYPVTLARLALCYGPTQSSEFLIPTLIDNCRAGRPTVLRRPHDRRDLLYVKDAVCGLRRLATIPLPGGTVINLATGIALSMIEVAQQVVRTMGERQQLIVVDEVPSQPDTTSYLCGSAALARELLGWTAETDFVEGLKLTLTTIQERAHTVLT